MNTYTIVIAQYDGSSTDQNPRVWISGAVNGASTGYIPTYWDMIQQAFATNGVSGVRQVLAPILLGCITGPPFPTIPVFQSSHIPAPVMGVASATSVICTQAVAAGTWAA